MDSPATLSRTIITSADALRIAVTFAWYSRGGRSPSGATGSYSSSRSVSGVAEHASAMPCARSSAVSTSSWCGPWSKLP